MRICVFLFLLRLRAEYKCSYTFVPVDFHVLVSIWAVDQKICHNLWCNRIIGNKSSQTEWMLCIVQIEKKTIPKHRKKFKRNQTYLKLADEPHRHANKTTQMANKTRAHICVCTFAHSIKDHFVRWRRHWVKHKSVELCNRQQSSLTGKNEQKKWIKKQNVDWFFVLFFYAAVFIIPYPIHI